MQLNKQTFRKLLILVGFGVLLNFAVQHLDTLDGAFSWVFAIIEPFVLGGVLAFILNVPMRAVERFLFPPKKTSVIETVLIKEGELQDKAGEVIRNSIPGAKKQSPKRPRFDIDRIRRPVSMIVTLLLVAAVVALVFGIVLPELIRTGTNLITNMPGYFESASVWVNKLLEDNPAILSYINDIIQQINLDEMSSRLMQFFAGQRTDPEHFRHRFQPGGRGGQRLHRPHLFLLYPDAEGAAGPPVQNDPLRLPPPRGGRTGRADCPPDLFHLLPLPLRAVHRGGDPGLPVLHCHVGFQIPLRAPVQRADWLYRPDPDFRGLFRLYRVGTPDPDG